MNVADKIYEIVKLLPEDQANEILDFAKFLQFKKQQEECADKSLDFRDTAGLGIEIWRSVDLEAYLEQERSSWD